jgi:Skp family chaperone for outer membrane proteins
MFWKTKLIVAIGAAVFGGLFLVQAPRSESGPELKIGFVDIFKVRSLSKKHVALVKELNEEKKRLADRLIQGKKDIEKRVREELPLYEKRTPEAEKLETELELKAYSLKLEEKRLMGQMNRKHLDLLESYVRDLSEAVRSYGKKNGFAAIFLRKIVPEVSEVRDVINVNNLWVLYHDEALDVTDEIVKVLNQE